MNNKQHLTSVNQEPGQQDVLQRIPLVRWIKDPETWDKYNFINEASQYLWDAYGSSTDQDKHALAMLAEVLETFVTCCKEIATKGLVVTHHNGVTGKNHHVDIRDKTITKAVLLMNELGLTPKSRFPLKPKPNPEFERFMRGPLGWSKENK
jgi:P27 family predicted phage terminase small subunit